MKKKKLLFPLVPLLLLAVFLYWSRPGTIEELYSQIDFEQMEWAGGYVHIYEDRGFEQTFVSTRWFPADSSEFDQFMELIQNTSFRRSLKTLLPLPGTRTSPSLQTGMYVLEFSCRDSDMEVGFDIQDFYGEYTIRLHNGNLREEYISIVDNDTWSAACRDLIKAFGQEQESSPN